MPVNLFSANWWFTMFVNTLVTIFFIYLLKRIFNKVNVPVVSNIVNEA